MQGCGRQLRQRPPLSRTRGWALAELGVAGLGWQREDTGRGKSFHSWLIDLGKSPTVPVRTPRTFLYSQNWGRRLGEPLSPYQTSGTSGPSFLCIFRVHDVNTGLCWHPSRKSAGRNTWHCPLLSVGSIPQLFVELCWVPSPLVIGLLDQARQ